MNTQPIQIQGVMFDCPAPYSAGHVLTENEATALNGVLSENLRNNFAMQMKRSETPLTQHAFDTYAATYAFGKRATGSKTVHNPVDKEERSLAKAAILASLATRGIKPRSVPADTLEAYITRAVESGKFRLVAEENVARTAALPQVELDLSDLEPANEDAIVAAPKAKREKKAA